MKTLDELFEDFTPIFDRCATTKERELVEKVAEKLWNDGPFSEHPVRLSKAMMANLLTCGMFMQKIRLVEIANTVGATNEEKKALKAFLSPEFVLAGEVGSANE